MDDSAPAGGQREVSSLATSVLLLNRHYIAIRIVNARRAFSLLFKDSAEVIDHAGGRYLAFSFDTWVDYSMELASLPRNGHRFVRTPRFEILVPAVIRLQRYDKVPRNEVKFNRRNVLARDDHRCQYCGRRYSAADLSLDHVVPRSRGGVSCWTNIVAACNPCNTKKGGRLPRQAGMKLLKKPVVPRHNPIISDNMRRSDYEVWRHFVKV